jgi:hypothetical protein
MVCDLTRSGLGHRSSTTANGTCTSINRLNNTINGNSAGQSALNRYGCTHAVIGISRQSHAHVRKYVNNYSRTARHAAIDDNEQRVTSCKPWSSVDYSMHHRRGGDNNKLTWFDNTIIHCPLPAFRSQNSLARCSRDNYFTKSINFSWLIQNKL